ncbi:T9SS type A sorting domain-containing protein [Flavobacteriaceae bacterium 144Ye]|nr:T9SS type A sorting domain-containing protein [Flavobacteriaceae bacterium 144Ye]
MFILLWFPSTAQTIEKFSIDNGGASTTNGNIQVLYTIGEVNVQETVIDNVIISEGFINPLDESPTLNTNHEVLSEQFKVFPNPASEILYVSGITVIDKITFYDSLGRLVYEAQNTNQINVSQFNIGMYMLQVLSSGRTSTYKIIVQ